MLNVAMGGYNDFEGEEDLLSDSVALMTVHAAKGLEWPIVFVPSLTKKRFPSRNSGKPTDWLIPRDLFDAERYEGTDADERRLFYVAITRAREWLALSAHERVTKAKGAISPYITEVHEAYEEHLAYPEPWSEEQVINDNPELHITYSELAAYLNCGYSYWLKNRIGFPPELVQEIGYGKAVHHLLRVIAEETQRKKRALTPIDVDRILATDFFLPFAGKAVAARFKESARKLVQKYLHEHGEDMQRVWETERPFELALNGVVVSGRADVILDKHDGSADSLAIVDYKTSIDERELGLQLQVYAAAGLREGLDVQGAFLHDLDKADRQPVDISPSAIEGALLVVTDAAQGIKDRKFDPNPEVSRCSRCDVRAFCPKVAK
jgi:DNA helicase-2/ATP-dependent DNA helicase PcrA